MTEPDVEWHREIEAEAGVALVRVDDEPLVSWPIPNVLTIFEAAMAYVGRHPHKPFCPVPPRSAPDKERQDHLIFYGLLEVPSERKRRSTGQDLARDIFGEPTRRVGRGDVKPVRRADRDGGELDPLYTEIPLDAVLDLARQRGDACGPITVMARAESTEPAFGSDPKSDADLLSALGEIKAAGGNLGVRTVAGILARRRLGPNAPPQAVSNKTDSIRHVLDRDRINRLWERIP